MSHLDLSPWWTWTQETLLVTAVLAAAAALLERPLRRRPAVRHLLWSVVLVRLLLPPAAVWPARPGLMDVLPPRSWWWSSPSTSPVDHAAAEAHAFASPPTRSDAAGERTSPSASTPAAVTGASPFAADRFISPQVVRPGSGAPVRQRGWRPTWLEIGGLLWLLGSLCAAVRLAAALRRLRRNLRTARQAPPELTTLVAEMCHKLGVRPPQVVVQPGLCSPCVVWFGRMYLLWPEYCSTSLAGECQRALLAHEGAHLLRRDPCWLWINQAVQVAWWWNPVAHWACARSSAAAEQACDALALEQTRLSRRCYAELFLELSTRPSRLDPAPAVGWRGTARHSVERRLTMILSDRVSGRTSRWVWVAAGLLAAAVLPAGSRGAESSGDTPGSVTAYGSGPAPAETAAAPPGVVLGGESAAGPTGSLGLVEWEGGVEFFPAGGSTMYGIAAPASRSSREQAILRLTGMYYTALAEDRASDAAALEEALRALGAPPAVLSTSADGNPALTVIQVWPAAAPLHAGAMLRHLRGHSGLALRLAVIGDSSGTVWGTEWYTDDSPVNAAAVHSGLVQPGETAEVVAVLGDPRDAFEGTVRHGVETLDYGSWPGSYRLASVEESPDAAYLLAVPAEFSGTSGVHLTLSSFVSADLLQPGTRIITHLTGRSSGAVWGSSVYTADSSLATAAVHAGVLADGESGYVQIVLGPGHGAYKSKTQHGVTSRSWSSYPLSFRLERLQSSETAATPGEVSSLERLLPPADDANGDPAPSRPNFFNRQVR